MTMRVSGPGGVTVQFPDGTDPATIDKVMREATGTKMAAPQVNAPQAPPPPAAPAPDGGTWLDPFVGQGILMGAGDEIKAGVRAGARRMFGDNPGKSYSDLYGQELADTRQSLGEFQQRHPVLSPVLETAGAIATTPLIPGGAAMRGATIGSRIARGAAAGAGYGAISGAASSDGGVTDRLAGGATGAMTGGLVGAAAPAVVRGIQAAGRGVRDYLAGPVARTARGIANRDAEASRRIGLAMKADAGIPQPRLTPADEAAAAISGGPVLNIDRGGETVRALARSAANTSPTGRAALETAVSDRFAGQGDRTIDTVRRIVGGATTADSRESLLRRAAAANRPAYAQAYREGDRPIWSPTMERLTSSPAVVDAMRAAAHRGKDKAVVQGYGGFNPGVTVDPSGIVTFRRGLTGQPTYPNLQYWDYVKQKLDDAANKARRAGAKGEASDLGGLAEQLRTELDTHVPSYSAARAGAARFFGAQDALTAGDQFVSSRLANDEAAKALQKMSQPERQLFAEGFADALTRKVAETGNRRNVINSIFIQSKAAKERVNLALGPQKAKELEAFLHVEALMDKARTAFGNSTTARQLTELGLAGGAGAYGTYTGDWKTSGTIIAGVLLKKGMGRIDRAVAQRVGEMLASPDPAVVQRGLRQVVNNDRLMAALRYADIPTALGGAQIAGDQTREPLKVYLNAGERQRYLTGPQGLGPPPPTP